MGRRKLQRWINAHFLNQGVEMAHDAEIDPSDFAINVEWRSSLQELFLPENADILEIIRTGAESLLGEPEQKLEEESGAPADPAVTKRAEMLARYAGIDKRMRPFLDEQWAFDDGAYVSELEAMLVHYMHHGEVADDDGVGAAVFETMSAVPFVDEFDSESRHKHGALVLEFPDPRHRLLAHAVCQYYGLLSESTTHNDGTRVMRVTPSKCSARLARSGIIPLTTHLQQRAIIRAVQLRDRVPRATVHRVAAGAGSGCGAGAHGAGAQRVMPRRMRRVIAASARPATQAVPASCAAQASGHKVDPDDAMTFAAV